MSNSLRMRRFSVLAMFMSLLLQLAMPAMAMPVPQAMSQREHGAHDHSGHHDKTELNRAEREQTPQVPHCPLAAPGCTIAMCMVCTALPPLVPVADAPGAVGGAPAPDLVQPLAQSTPRPLLPPPRA
ncbi:hypothetical protein ACFSE1_10400 [Rhizobium helianthi]|uniref:DUF2946 domain-containing protein n=1 Tax=Rhizobium helianthi TaxID=1132695 RepID=A0ABW4M6N8_9HYPH